MFSSLIFKNAMPYSIYVVELKRKVFNDNWKFRNANPQFNPTLQCLYVGMTSKTPRERFQQHINGGKSKKGIKISSWIVETYGSYLRPSLYNEIPKLRTRAEVLAAEQNLALKLRREGYAFWFN